jgi:hypothetical protein
MFTPLDLEVMGVEEQEVAVHLGVVTLLPILVAVVGAVVTMI